MAIIRGNRWDFPSRPPKLDLGHPMVRGSSARLVAAANADGSFAELVSNYTYNWLATRSADQGGGVDAFGPYGFQAATTGSGNCGVPIPVIYPSEVFTGLTTAAIFSPINPSYAQTLVCISNSSGIAGPVLEAGGQLKYTINGTTPIVFPPTLTNGHLYMVVVSCNYGTHVGPREFGVLLDLSTGEAWEAAASYAGVTVTGDTTAYSVVTYGPGSAANVRVYAAAMSAGQLTPNEVRAWVYDDPWSLWYSEDAPTIRSLQRAVPIVNPNDRTLRLATNDAVEFMDFAVSVSNPAAVTLDLIANDAVETMLFYVSAPSPATVDTHDGGQDFVPPWLADRWDNARRRFAQKGRGRPADRPRIIKPKTRKRFILRARSQ